MLLTDKDLKDLADLKWRNKLADRYFWNRDTVRFFKHRDESTLIDGHFFIYSIQNEDNPRIYCVGWGSRAGVVQRLRDGFTDTEQAREWIGTHGGYYTEGCDGGCYNSHALALRYPIGENSAACLCYQCWNAENDRRASDGDTRPNWSWSSSIKAGKPICES